jgi:hypothetical protein
MIAIIIIGLLAGIFVFSVLIRGNARLPEEVKVQRYETKQRAKANTGGALFLIGIPFFILIWFLMYLFPQP